MNARSQQASLFADEKSRRKIHHVGTTFELMAWNVLADERDGLEVNAFRLGVANAILDYGRNRRALAEVAA